MARKTVKRCRRNLKRNSRRRRRLCGGFTAIDQRIQHEIRQAFNIVLGTIKKMFEDFKNNKNLDDYATFYRTKQKLIEPLMDISNSFANSPDFNITQARSYRDFIQTLTTYSLSLLQLLKFISNPLESDVRLINFESKTIIFDEKLKNLNNYCYTQYETLYKLMEPFKNKNDANNSE